MTQNATVTMLNSGTTSWTSALAYSLGANMDTDPFSANNRIAFADSTVCVPPGGNYTFNIALTAPLTPGTYTSDWRMVQDGVEWFGDVVSQDITVSCASQGFDLSTALVVDSPMDIASWPITETITSITMATPAGLSFTFDPVLPDSWKWFTGNGTTDNYQYTVWAMLYINGQWVTSGFIQMWQGRDSTGAPIIAEFPINWAYDSRWGPMNGYQPTVGEQMGFFVSAGNARGTDTVTSVKARSNVVFVNLPANDTGTFQF